MSNSAPWMCRLPATTRPPLGHDCCRIMSVHTPPASRTSKVPAATSHGARPISQ
ncbi:Uncharacterised protein [Bordetella pertussis]|nr:Uncharacterised protein [Bordetella pertussis]